MLISLLDSAILKVKIGGFSGVGFRGSPLLGSDLVDGGLHEDEGRGRKGGGSLNLESDLAARGRVDGGHAKLVALRDGGGGEVATASGAGGAEMEGEGVKDGLALRGSGRGNGWGDRSVVGYPEKGQVGSD
ncbi:hypothetical protein VNO78_30555 [Psophocarpus tetragonolobus]|uniref:Uncharacterized protein n=1 Tax=Psophocarpus tetragonolobus TaxID=3891 RepID=A0AAN9X5G0_PSOTE